MSNEPDTCHKIKTLSARQKAKIIQPDKESEDERALGNHGKEHQPNKDLEDERAAKILQGQEMDNRSEKEVTKFASYKQIKTNNELELERKQETMLFKRPDLYSLKRQQQLDLPLKIFVWCREKKRRA